MTRTGFKEHLHVSWVGWYLRYLSIRAACKNPPNGASLPKTPGVFLVFLQASFEQKDSWSSSAQHPTGEGIWTGIGNPNFGFSHEHWCAAPQCQGQVFAPSKPHQCQAAKQKEWQTGRNEPEGGRGRRGILALSLNAAEGNGDAWL